MMKTCNTGAYSGRYFFSVENEQFGTTLFVLKMSNIVGKKQNKSLKYHQQPFKNLILLLCTATTNNP